jgi:myo-inositol-1(or 4)-monophosphatase
VSSSAELLDLAVTAAKLTGAFLIDSRPVDLMVRTKSTPTDVVTMMDTGAEQLIAATIRSGRPGDAIVGEEGADDAAAAGNRVRWIVDPIDGTVNFLYGIPQWCVSVAVHDHAGGVAGAVYDPLRDELFAGCRGGGPPTCNGAAVRGSTQDDLARALIATGFAYDPAVRTIQGEAVARLLPQVRDVRRMGSAALDMAWTAAGRYDAFYERGVHLWDIAAGSLLCEVAGLTVRPLDADGARPAGVMAAPPGLADALAAIVE